jgi:lambda family phage portal protein
MVPMRHLAAYAEAELVAARTAASKMGFFQRKSEIGISGIADGSDSNGSFTMSADPGTFGVLPDGYELSSWSPDHPSTAFSDFMKTQLRDVATGLGVTYNALANDLENVNYSSIRAGLLIERDMWRCLQRWWICAFLRPVYSEWLNMSLLGGAVVLDNRDVRRFVEARWIPRGWAWVDPLKDTQAGIMAIGAGLASRTSLLAEQGLDHEQVFEELQEEEKLAEQMDLDIEVKPESPEQSTPDVEDESEDAPGSMDVAETEEDAGVDEQASGVSANGTGGGRTIVPEHNGAQAINNRLHRHR